MDYDGKYYMIGYYIKSSFDNNYSIGGGIARKANER